MIKIIARFAVVSTRNADFLAAARELIHCTQQEPGCLSYELYQEEHNPNQFVFIEEWRNLEAIELHNQSKHLEAFHKLVPSMVAAPPEVKRYTPAKYEK